MDYIRLLEYKTKFVENLRPFINDKSFTDACAKRQFRLIEMDD